MFSLKNLTLRHSTPLFSNLTLEIQRGKLYHIIGPNGSGKTSLLRSLAGLIPSIYDGEISGEILFGGRPVEEQNFSGLIALSGTWAAARLFCNTVWEEVTYSPDNSPQRAAELLDYFGLGQEKEKNPQTLSGGQQQLVLLIAYLAGDPDVLFLDEIFAQLSRDKRELLANHLKDLHHQGKTIVLVDHVLPDNLSSLVTTIELQQTASIPEFTEEMLVFPQKPIPLQINALQISHNNTPLFPPINLELSPGSFCSIQGDIGSGKTSILQAIAGLVPYAGDILIKGKEGKQWSWKDRALNIGVVSQLSDTQFFCSTVEKEIVYSPSRLKNLDASWIQTLIEACGLATLSNRSPYQLSQGEMKRLQLAIALANGPGLLVLDEPETSLDHVSQQILIKILICYLQAGNSLVLVSHNKSLVKEISKYLPQEKVKSIELDGVPLEI